MSGHVSQQPVTRFLQAALECSIYVSPTEPGLIYEELVEAGKQAEFLPGEINDAIPYVTTRTFGGGSKRLLPNRNLLPLLMMFIPPQEPDYRNPQAFEFVFAQLKQSVRMHGVGNAKVERSVMMDLAAAQQLPKLDIEVAIAIMTMNEILIEEDHSVRFAPGKDSYGSPAQQLATPVRIAPIRKETLARVYPIVKDIVERRTHARLQEPGGADNGHMQGASLSADPEMSLKKEWISAASAIALVGLHCHLATRAVCKRAYAGLVKARAERLIRGGQSADNVDVPAEFWWAEGEAALEQNWASGDFETWLDKRIQIRAFGVTFRRSDIELLRPVRTVEDAPSPALMSAKALEEGQRMTAAGKKVFIGHGRSPAWRELKDFLQDRLHLTTEEFNSIPTAGVPTTIRLGEMLDNAAFAFLVMTAEDVQPNGAVHARLNVVHETGLFQGRLGFKKAIILLETGCEDFSNIDGLGQIRFPKDSISSKFEEIRHVLERENIVSGRTGS